MALSRRISTTVLAGFVGLSTLALNVAIAQQASGNGSSPMDYPLRSPAAPSPYATGPKLVEQTPKVPAQPSPLLGKKPPPHLSVPMHERVKQDPLLLDRLTSELPAVGLPGAAQPSTIVPITPPPRRGEARAKPVATPDSGSWIAGPKPAGNPPLSNPILLPDGSVMAHQSCTGNWWKLIPDQHLNYQNGTWVQLASMPSGHTPRFFSSGLLPDGRVIAVGGEYNTGCASAWTNKGSLYNPLTDSWINVPPPAGWANIGYAAQMLASGTYMQADVLVKQAALFNPATLAWTLTGGGKFDSYDEESFSLLQNDRVLTVDAYVDKQPTCGTNSETYSETTGTWTSAGNTPSQLADCQPKAANHGATFEIGPLPVRFDGTAVQFGGTTGNGTSPGPTPIGIYNPSSGWTAGPNVPAVGGVNYTLADAPAAVLPNGNILFAASPNTKGFLQPTHFFEMTPANAITQVADNSDSASTTSFQWNLLVLPNGQVLALPTDNSNVWIYTSQWQFFNSNSPIVTSMPKSLVAGQTYTLTGSQLNGLTEGAYYGDDVNGSTNYPFIFLYDRANNVYNPARTFNNTSRSIAPNKVSSVDFTVPTGLAAGNYELYVCASGSCGGDVIVPVTPVSHARKYDFNNDGRGDFIWQNDNGVASVWLMNNGNFAGAASYGLTADWKVIGGGRFNAATGTTSMLLRHTSGYVGYWTMSGLSITGFVGLGNVSNDWTIVATGDFDGDGTDDILWRYKNDGTLYIWKMSGNAIVGGANIGPLDTNWMVSAVGDFNGDGKADIFLRYSPDGTTYLWFMNFGTIASGASLGTVDKLWSVATSGDFNGDGRTDIVWRHADGTGYIWLINGSSIAGGGSLGVISQGYRLSGTGDYDGDGKADIVLRNVDTSDISTWKMNGAAVALGKSLGPYPLAYKLVQ